MSYLTLPVPAIQKYPSASNFPISAANGTIAEALDTHSLYAYDSILPGWVLIATPAAGSAITALSGDVSATGPGVAVATVNSVGGSSAASINTVVSNTSGVNSGNVTLGTPNGLSLVGQALSLALSSAGTTGALSSADWNTFNNSATGGPYLPLTGGTISGILSLVIGNGLRFNGIGDPNWQIGLNLGILSHPHITTNAVELVVGAGAGTDGLVFGNNTGTAYLELASNSNAYFTGNVTALNLSGTNTGDQTITLTGGVTGSGTGSFVTTLTNSAVIGQLLTSYLSSPGTVSASDSLLIGLEKIDGNVKAIILSEGAANGIATLDGGGKIPVAQLPSSVMLYLGAWDASINSPLLADGTGVNGDTYRTSVAGTQNLGSGPQTFFVGDFVIYNGSIWQRSPAADGVTSVNGFTGAVVLTTTDINEGTNLYFTNARARNALSVDGGSDPLAYNSGTGQFSMPAASGSQNGYLTSTDWTTFNSKQASGNYITALTGDATATGPGSVAITLATVNGNVGTFGSSTSIPTITVNAKGLITAASGNVVIAPAGTLSGTTLNGTVVSSSLTSVGTITSGTWNGTTIAIANGGTGTSSTSQNFAFIGPTSGSGAPSFRALVAGDIPSLTGTYASLALDNLASVAINTSLLPGTDNTIDVGSTTKRFRTLYGGTSVISPLIKGVDLSSGSSTPVTVALRGGNQTSTGNGGALNINGGNSSAATGGDLTILSGSGTTDGSLFLGVGSLGGVWKLTPTTSGTSAAGSLLATSSGYNIGSSVTSTSPSSVYAQVSVLSPLHQGLDAATGQNVIVRGGNSTAAGNVGGTLSVTGGNNTNTSGTAAGGALTIQGGSATGGSSTGSGGALNLAGGTTVGGTAGIINIQTAGSTRWTIDASGNLIAGTDNSYTIGAVGATRPSTLYTGTSVISPAHYGGTASSAILTLSSNSLTPGTSKGTLFIDNGDSFGTYLASNVANFRGTVFSYANGGQLNFSLVAEAGLGTSIASYNCRGTYSSPTQMASGDNFGIFEAYAYGGAGNFINQEYSYTAFWADETHTTTAMGMRYSFNLLRKGTKVKREVLRIDSKAQVILYGPGGTNDVPNLLWNTDNIGSIGLTGANRPSDIFVGTSIKNESPQTTLTGAAGTAVCSQPERGSSYKKVIVYLNAYTDTSTQTYTYPVAFSQTPFVSGVGAGVSGATASTTSVTFTTTLISGFVIIEGY